MKPTIISWNMRGLNDYRKRLRVKNLIQKWSAAVIYFQETKQKLVNQTIVNSLWSCQCVGWIELVSKEASGGIIIMWNRRLEEMVDHYVGEFMVACRFKCVDDRFEWALAGIYGPNVDYWRVFTAVGMLHGVSGGDFNITRFPSEQVGDNYFSHAMNTFSDLIF
ncbi:hypothetical protein CIPAW_02G126700 [Carya illinoinensis]|uniref:Uncharacterized protein n=1 Tax=Carya illinoinensis TaxID=32201 RepID=A0A8T1RE58_CARIL|nr:hypothetical protein CIPAW_02G126700 [Carya illinoinensis]